VVGTLELHAGRKTLSRRPRLWCKKGKSDFAWRLPYDHRGARRAEEDEISRARAVSIRLHLMMRTGTDAYSGPVLDSRKNSQRGRRDYDAHAMRDAVGTGLGHIFYGKSYVERV